MNYTLNVVNICRFYSYLNYSWVLESFLWGSWKSSGFLSALDQWCLWNHMVPTCAEWWGEMGNQAATPFGYFPSTQCFFLFSHIAQTPDETHARNILIPLWRTGGDNQDTIVLCGWRLFSNTSNPITSHWMKQSMWLRIVHSGDWCIHLALCSPSAACLKRRRTKLFC